MTTQAWASLRGGKWHAVVLLPVSFRAYAHSLCGEQFEPLNVSEGFPNYAHFSAMCAKCSAAVNRSER